MRQYLVISSAITQQQAPKNTKVASWTTSSLENINLYDYDGILIDVSSIPKRESAIINAGEQRLNFHTFEFRIFTPEVIYRILSRSEAFVVLLGDPSTQLGQFSAANRLGLALIMTPSHGTNLINKCEKHQPFFDYMKQVKNYSYAFRNNPRMNEDCAHAISYFGERPLLSIEPLLSIKVGDSIAARIGGPGFSELYLLPVLPSGVPKSIDQIFDVLASGDDDIVSEPEWASTIKATGQKEVDDQIAETDRDIVKLNNKRNDLMAKKAKIRQPIEILYKIGKELENSIKVTLRDIGITVTDPSTTEGREFTFEFNGQKFVVEVKSTERQFFDKNGLRQVVEWQDDVLLESGEKYKPVFIASNETKKPAQDRQEAYLPPNLLQFAQERKIATISVSVLYEFVEKIKRGDLEVSELIDLLLKTDGIVGLSDIAS